MSKEIMAECLEEAKNLYAAASPLEHGTEYLLENHAEAIVLLAVALYQERCEDARDKAAAEYWDIMPLDERGENGNGR